MAGVPAALYAQSQTGTSAEGIADIVVTAQRREESLQKTPISVAALTGAALEARGIASISDLQSEVPNLQLTPHPNSATTARIFIRGVGNLDDQITQDPSVAVYVDGIYVGRSQGLASDIAEIERVEVLRGPQGSLYGRNTTGGAINFISRAPQLGVIEGKQAVSVGNYDYLRTRTRLNIPVGDTIAVELGYVHAQKDGFVRNPGTDIARYGDQRRDGYRAAVRWMPNSALDIRYTYDRSDIQDTPPFIAATSFYPGLEARPTRGSAAVVGLERNDALVQGHNLTMSLKLSETAEIRSLTGYRRLSNFSNQHYMTGVLGPFALFRNTFDDHQKQFSEELQVIGSALDNQLSYVLGLYYFEEKARTASTVLTAAGARTDRAISAKNTAYAVYGQGTWTPASLDDRLHVTLGARWSRDKRQADLQDRLTAANGTVTVLPAGEGNNSFSNVSPTLIIAYDLNRNINTYAKVSRGYKSGGFNVRASSVGRFNEGFAPESLTSYELGFKSDLLDRRLRVNVALFHANYKDIQVNLQTDATNPTRTDVLNAGKARIYGMEMDVTAKPVDSLTVTASYGYTNAKYQRIDSPLGANLADSFVFTNIPRHSITTGIEYDIARTRFGNLSAAVNYSFQDKAFAASNDKRMILPDYGLLDARLTLSDIDLGKVGARLSLWGRNLTDQDYLLFKGAIGLPNRAGAIYGEPRSYGLDLTASF